MKLGILKRLFAASSAAILVFSMAGCVSNTSTENAKLIGNSNDAYNIADYEEEEVVVNPVMNISFSEKGTVRYEGTNTNLIDFWEYGSDETNTIYFEGPGDTIFASYYERNDIEFAFEYKEMIYFLKRTYDYSKTKYDYTLYRMNLKGENITKVSAFSLQKKDSGSYYYDDELDNYSSVVYPEDYSVEYYIRDVYVQNNNLVFNVEYYGAYDSNKIYKIDLTSGTTNELIDIGDDYSGLSFVRIENDYTYLYVYDYNNDYDYDEDDENTDNASQYDDLMVYKIDNKTNQNSKFKLSEKLGKVYSEVIGIYDGKLVCSTEDYIDLIDNEGNKKSVFVSKENGYANAYDAMLTGDYVLTGSVNSTESVYKCNLKTGEVERINNADLSKTMFSVGNKYICYKEPTEKEREKYEEQYFNDMNSIFSSYRPFDYSKHIFWSKEEDVLADKHNYMPIKNFPRSDIYYGEY